jgi:hypothetical protein
VEVADDTALQMNSCYQGIMMGNAMEETCGRCEEKAVWQNIRHCTGPGGQQMN